MWSKRNRVFSIFALFAVIAPSLVSCNMEEAQYIAMTSEQHTANKDYSRVLLSLEPNTTASTHVIRGCDYARATLKCPKIGQMILNATIKYGRWDNTICLGSSGQSVNASTPSKFKDYTLWHAIGHNSYLMDGNRHTHVDINENVYVGMYKHWEINFTCGPKNVIYGCESNPVRLTCPKSYINTASIRYGRWNNAICPHPTVSAYTQSKFKDYSLSRAIGQSSYTMDNMTSDVDINEDIYPRVFKHWKVTFSCILPPVLGGCDSSQTTITCPEGQVISEATIRYGRWNNAICPSKTVGKYTPSKFKDYKLSCAIGKRVYSLAPNSSHVDINEDIYPGKRKHWQIYYRCVANGYVSNSGNVTNLL
jgi:hypothetical protein